MVQGGVICVLVLAAAVAGVQVVSVDPLLAPFFSYPSAPVASAASVFVEEFGPVGSSVVAYEGICLAYKNVGPKLSINVADVATMLQAGMASVTTMRNDTTSSAFDASVFELIVPAAATNLGRALLASTANLFGWDASAGYPNASVITVAASQDAVATALLASSSPAIGVISYLKSVQVGLPCVGIRPGNNNAFVSVAALRTLYKLSYSEDQATATCTSSGVNAISYPLVGCITIRIVRGSTCNAVAEDIVTQTLRTAQDLLVGTTSTGILPLFRKDAVKAYASFLADSCTTTTNVQLTGSSATSLLVRYMMAARNEPGFSLSFTTQDSTSVMRDISNDNYLIATSELTVSQASVGTTLGSASLQMIPAALIACPLVYNLPSRPELRLPRCLLPSIMKGQVTMWNHRLIQQVNPSLVLPAQKIRLAVRSTDSGITACVQAALAEIERGCNNNVTFAHNATWMYPAAANASVPGMDDMINFVLDNQYTLGYASYNFAVNNGLMRPGLIDIRNADVTSDDTLFVTNVTVDPTTMEVSFPTPAYPFVTTSYFVFNKDRTTHCAEMAQAVHFMEWMLSDPAAYAVMMADGYIPLPDEVHAMALARLRLTAHCSGNFLFTQPKSTLSTVTIILCAVGIPMGILLIIMIVVAVHLAREREKRQQQVNRSIELTTDIAGALCDYDLEYVDLLLDEYCQNEHHNAELVKPFRELRTNLGEYRPYIPRFLLPESNALKQSMSHNSANSMRSLKSVKAQEQEAHRASVLSTASPKGAVISSGQVQRKICLAAVDFVGSTFCSGAPKSKLTSSAAIDTAAIAVHAALASTNGVLHCFIGDSVVASWNSAKNVLQPEKKACRFLCILQKDATVKDLQMTGVVVSGNACCHTGGDSKQRTLIVCGPALFGRLETSRTFAQQSSTLVIDASVRGCVNVDFMTMPYTVQAGEAFYEILKDNSEDDEKDEEWMYRVAKAENNTDAKLESVVQHWIAGRHSAAVQELDTVTTNDEAISSRLSALRGRIPQ